MLIVSGICAHHQKELKSVCKEINGIDYDMSAWGAVRERVCSLSEQTPFCLPSVGERRTRTVIKEFAIPYTNQLCYPAVYELCLFVCASGSRSPKHGYKRILFDSTWLALASQRSLLVCKS